jgi:hypothetical protein
MLMAWVTMLPVLSKGGNTIFDDFGAGDTYYCCEGWTASGPNSPYGTFWAANEFTSSGDYSVTQIDLGIGYVSGTNSATVELTTDNGGIPGTVLGSWGISGQPSLGAATDVITTIGGISGVDISAGDYFLVVLPGASDTWDALNWNIIGTTGLDEYNQGTGWVQQPGQTLGAFDVLGNATTPEPSTLLLLGVGLLSIYGLRRRSGPRSLLS